MQFIVRLLAVIVVLVIFVTLGELVLSLFARGIMPH
jgi:CDP-diglyceride synthetase